MVQIELHRSNEAQQPDYVIVRSVGNGKVLFWSENYSSRANAIAAGNILLNNGLRAQFLDLGAA